MVNDPRRKKASSVGAQFEKLAHGFSAVSRRIRAWKLLGVAWVLPFTFATDSAAGPKLALHLTAPVAKNACARTEASPKCQDVVTAGNLNPIAYYVYLLLVEGDATVGVAGITLGVTYDSLATSGVDVFSWTRCSDLDFPMEGWPSSGSGNTLTWSPESNCQVSEPGGPGTGVTATGGYFYCAAYTSGVLGVVPHPLFGAAQYVPCSVATTDTSGSIAATSQPSTLLRLGYVSFSPFGLVPGWRPCGVP
jgi:hypothetical protein